MAAQEHKSHSRVCRLTHLRNAGSQPVAESRGALHWEGPRDLPSPLAEGTRTILPGRSADGDVTAPQGPHAHRASCSAAQPFPRGKFFLLEPAFPSPLWHFPCHYMWPVGSCPFGQLTSQDLRQNCSATLWMELNKNPALPSPSSAHPFIDAFSPSQGTALESDLQLKQKTSSHFQQQCQQIKPSSPLGRGLQFSP